MRSFFSIFMVILVWYIPLIKLTLLEKRSQWVLEQLRSNFGWKPRPKLNNVRSERKNEAKQYFYRFLVIPSWLFPITEKLLGKCLIDFWNTFVKGYHLVLEYIVEIGPCFTFQKLKKVRSAGTNEARITFSRF